MDEPSYAHGRDVTRDAVRAITDTGRVSSPNHRTNAALPSLDGPMPALFCAAGVALAVVGALPWAAALAGDGEAAGWPIRILGVLAFAVGVFVALVGIGLFRARDGLRAAAAEAELDTALVAAAASALTNTYNTEVHDPCATDTACASCDATCALSALR
jgi:hypothetical protein